MRRINLIVISILATIACSCAYIGTLKEQAPSTEQENEQTFIDAMYNNNLSAIPMIKRKAYNVICEIDHSKKYAKKDFNKYTLSIILQVSKNPSNKKIYRHSNVEFGALLFKDSTCLGVLDHAHSKNLCYWNSTEEPHNIYTYILKHNPSYYHFPNKPNEYLDFARKIKALKPDIIITSFSPSKFFIYIFLKDHQIYVGDNAAPKDYSIQKITPINEYKKLHPSSYKEDLLIIYYNSLEEFYFPTKT